MINKNVIIWVESMLGAGHMRIASQLSKALSDYGAHVSVVSGTLHRGADFDFGGAEKIALPELARDPVTNRYQTPNGLSAKDDLAWSNERLNILRNLFDQKNPAAIVTEMWPFERGASFDRELLPFVDYVHERSADTKLYSLTRDIMLMSQAGCSGGSQAQTIQTLSEKFNGGVIVRGDDNIIKLSDTFAEAASLKGIFYAGYFATQGQGFEHIDERDREVIVSTGGGYTKLNTEPVYIASIAARKHSRLKDNPWVLKVNKDCPEDVFQEICERAYKEDPNGGITVERNGADFRDRLHNAALSISEGGYNTMAESVISNIPSVVVPRTHSASNNLEQLKRALQFDIRGLVKLGLREDISNAARFGQLIDTAYENHQDFKGQIRFNGAENAAKHILNLS